MRNFSFEQQELCGHLVTSEVKKLWSVELELLDVLKRVCNKHNIKYFALGGTLLGAVRHKGFIPWDDDIDIAMFADDYEKFCNVAATEINGDYFFQYYKTEPGFNIGMARIRKNTSTAITQFEYDNYYPSKTYNFGVFIDIFPLCHTSQGTFMGGVQRILYSVFMKMFSGRRKECYMKKNNTKRYYFSKGYLLWKLANLFFDYDQIVAMFIKICDLCKASNTVGLLAFSGFNEKMMWNKKWWEDTCIMRFENTNIVCPKGYDAILKRQYGDYMKFKKGTAIHTMKFFDAETPFEEILDNESMGQCI